MAHVLIVEDDREIGDLMLMLLEGMGHRVDFANSGSGALRLLSQAQHDVIFTDVHMRPMDGLELIASVKKSRPQVVFVFISGDNNPDLQDRAMQLGALEFLHKPIKVDELRLVVARALKRAERERAAVDGSPVPAPPAPVSRPAQSVEPELEGFFPGKAFAATRRQLAQFSAHNRHALIEAPSGMLDDELLRFLHGAGAFAAGALSIQDAAAAPIKSLDEL
ncbi:MAG: response regulator, partial [Verrucomicrobia bacterium]|nr:response regulator [Verrucomicrobiota bacterium]